MSGKKPSPKPKGSPKKPGVALNPTQASPSKGAHPLLRQLVTRSLGANDFMEEADKLSQSSRRQLIQRLAELTQMMGDHLRSETSMTPEDILESKGFMGTPKRSAATLPDPRPPSRSSEQRPSSASSLKKRPLSAASNRDLPTSPSGMRPSPSSASLAQSIDVFSDASWSALLEAKKPETVFREQSPESRDSWIVGMSAQLKRMRDLCNSVSTAPQALPSALTACRELFNASSVFAYEVRNGHVNPLPAIGGAVVLKSVPVGKGFAGHVAQTGEYIYAANPQQDSRYDSHIDGEIPANHKLLSAPIVEGGRVIGILQVASSRATKADLPCLRAFAFSAALALRSDGPSPGAAAAVAVASASMPVRTPGSGRESRVQQKFSAIIQIFNVVSSTLHITRLMDVLQQKSKKLLEADRCTLFMVDHKHNMLTSTLADGKEIRIPLSTGIAGHVAAKGITVNIPDAYKDSRFNPDGDKSSGYKTRSILCTPVRSEGEILAVINVVNKGGAEGDGIFDEEDEELLKVFSDQAAIALRNAQRYRESVDSRDFLDNVLSSITLYVASLDLDGRLNSSNRPLEPLLGINEDDMKSNSYSSWLSSASLAKLKLAIDHVDKTGRPRHVSTFTLIGPKGEVPINFSVVPLFGKDRVRRGTLLVIEDEAETSVYKDRKKSAMVPGAASSGDVPTLDPSSASPLSNPHTRAAKESARRTVQQLEALMEITKVVSSELEIAPLMEILRQKSRFLLAADRCTLFLVDDLKKELFTTLPDGKEIRIPLDTGIAGHVAETGAIVNIPDAYQDERFNPDGDKASGYKTKSMLCLPVKDTDGDIIAVINVINKGGTGDSAQPFDSQDEDTLQMFSQQAAVAIRNSRLYINTMETRDFLQSVLSSITHYVLALNSDGQLVESNRSLKQLLSASEDSMRTTSYADWMKNATLAKIKMAIDHVLSQGRPSFLANQSILTPGGTTNVNVSVVPLIHTISGERKGAIVVVEDTAQLEAMRERRKSVPLGTSSLAMAPLPIGGSSALVEPIGTPRRGNRVGARPKLNLSSKLEADEDKMREQLRAEAKKAAEEATGGDGATIVIADADGNGDGNAAPRRKSKKQVSIHNPPEVSGNASDSDSDSDYSDSDDDNDDEVKRRIRGGRSLASLDDSTRTTLKYQALIEISHLVSADLDPDSLMSLLQEKSKELLEADRCTLFLVDRKSQQLVSRLADGQMLRIPLDTGIAGHVAASGNTVNIPDAYKDDRFNPNGDKSSGYKTRSILCTPVKSEGETIAVINVVNKGGLEGYGIFNEEDEEMLKVFSHQAAISIRNSRRYQDTHKAHQFLNNVLRSLTHYVISLDLDGRLNSTNHSVEMLLSVQERVMRESPYTDWLSSASFSKLRMAIDHAAKEGRPTFGATFSLLSAAGSKTLNFTVVPLKDDKRNRLGTVVILEDVQGSEATGPGGNRRRSSLMRKTPSGRIMPEEHLDEVTE